MGLDTSGLYYTAPLFVELDEFSCIFAPDILRAVLLFRRDNYFFPSLPLLLSFIHFFPRLEFTTMKIQLERTKRLNELYEAFLPETITR